VSPIARIEEISFSSTGKLVPEETSRLAPSASKFIRLNGTAILANNMHPDTHMNNIMEMIKAVGRQEHTKRLARNVDSRGTPFNGLYRGCHLGLLLHEDELKVLVDRVGSFTCSIDEAPS
jgi:hypothetical protein